MEKTKFEEILSQEMGVHFESNPAHAFHDEFVADLNKAAALTAIEFADWIHEHYVGYGGTGQPKRWYPNDNIKEFYTSEQLFQIFQDGNNLH